MNGEELLWEALRLLRSSEGATPASGILTFTLFALALFWLKRRSRPRGKRRRAPRSSYGYGEQSKKPGQSATPANTQGKDGIMGSDKIKLALLSASLLCGAGGCTSLSGLGTGFQFSVKLELTQPTGQTYVVSPASVGPLHVERVGPAEQ